MVRMMEPAKISVPPLNNNNGQIKELSPAVVVTTTATNDDTMPVSSNGDTNNNSTTSSRISTLDACYEVVKEKLDRLREEIRRIRMTKQQEQLQQSMHAKRFSMDANSGSGTTAATVVGTTTNNNNNNNQFLVPPVMSNRSSVSPISSKSSISPNRMRHRLPINTRTLEHNNDPAVHHNNFNTNSSSNEDETGEESNRTLTKASLPINRSRRQQQNGGETVNIFNSLKRSPKVTVKPRLSRQNEVNLNNDTGGTTTATTTTTEHTTTSGKEGSESPVWVPNNQQYHLRAQTLNLPNRHKSLNARSVSPPAVTATATSSHVVLGPAMSRNRSKTLRESPYPPRIVAENGGGGLSYQIIGENSPKVEKLFLSSPTNRNNQQQQQELNKQKSPTIITASSSVLEMAKTTQPSTTASNGHSEKKFEDALKVLKRQESDTTSKQQQQQTGNVIRATIGTASPATVRPMLGAIKALEITTSADRVTNNNNNNRFSKGDTTPTNKQNPPPVMTDSKIKSNSNNHHQQTETGSETQSEQSGSIRSRTGSFQQKEPLLQQQSTPLALSTVVLPQHSAGQSGHHHQQQQQQQQQQASQLRRPPRSFTVRTNATPENELEEPPPAPQQSSKTTLPLPAQPSGHSMSVSPQRCLIIPVSAAVTVDGSGNRSTSRSTSGSSSHKSLTPSISLLSKNSEPDTNHHPPRQLFIDTKIMKSPLIPVISPSSGNNNNNTSNNQANNHHHNQQHPSLAGSTPILIGGRAIKASPSQKQQAANKLVSAIMGVPSSLLSNDSSSYENLDQTGPSVPSTSSSVLSGSGAAPVPPFPVPSAIAAANKAAATTNITVDESLSSSSSSSTATTNNSTKTQQQPQQNVPRQDSLNKTEQTQQNKPTKMMNKTTSSPHPPQSLIQQLQQQQHQRKSALLASEVEHFNNNKQIRARVFPYQRNSLDLVSPPLPSFSHSYQDTDSELEGIFGECEVVDDFETSTTMSDSPSLFSDAGVWPVMVGNNVVVSKRRPRAYGQKHHHQARKNDPPRVADATQAAQIANRRGSLARPRPTIVGNNHYPTTANNRSTADLHSTPTSAPSTATQQQTSNSTSLPPPPPPPPPVEQQQHQQQVPSQQPVPALTTLQQKQSALLNSPRIAPTTLAALHQQRRLQQQRAILGAPNVQVPLGGGQLLATSNSSSSNSTTTSANNNNNNNNNNNSNSNNNSNKPSLTGLLYGVDAANRANQHLSQYTFRGANNSLQQQQLGRQYPLSMSRSGSSNNQQAALKSGVEIRPLAIGGTLSINNAPPPSLPVINDSGSNNNNATTATTAGQVSVASVIFNSPLPHQQQLQHQQTEPSPASATTSLSRHSHNRHSQRGPSSGTSADNNNNNSKSSSSSHHRHHHRRRGTVGAPVEIFAAAAAANQNQRRSQAVGAT